MTRSYLLLLLALLHSSFSYCMDPNECAPGGKSIATMGGAVLNDLGSGAWSLRVTAGTVVIHSFLEFVNYLFNCQEQIPHTLHNSLLIVPIIVLPQLLLGLVLKYAGDVSTYNENNFIQSARPFQARTMVRILGILFYSCAVHFFVHNTHK